MHRNSGSKLEHKSVRVNTLAALDAALVFVVSRTHGRHCLVLVASSDQSGFCGRLRRLVIDVQPKHEPDSSEPPETLLPSPASISRRGLMAPFIRSLTECVVQGRDNEVSLCARTVLLRSETATAPSHGADRDPSRVGLGGTDRRTTQ